MPAEPKGDRIWLALCTATGVAVDVTLNKYASTLPGWVVLCLWGVPLVLFVVWFWRVETTKAWVKRRFLEHPVSYVLMFLILIPFGWQATANMIAKLRAVPGSVSSSVSAKIPQSSSSPAPPMAALPDRVVPFPPRSQKQDDADQLEARRLVLEYRADHPGVIDEKAELDWINKHLASKGIPFTVTTVTIFKEPSTQSRTTTPAASNRQGIGIVGAHGETDLDGVQVAGFPTGIDLSPSQKADVKNTHVYAQQPLSPPPAQQNDHGIINNGPVTGSSQAVQDNRQYGVSRPPPSAHFFQQSIPAIDVSKLSKTEIMMNPELSNGRLIPSSLNPGVGLSITSDDDFALPTFHIECSGPCEITLADIATRSGDAVRSEGIGWRIRSVAGDDNGLDVAFSIPILESGESIGCTIRSLSRSPVTVVSVTSVPRQ